MEIPARQTTRFFVLSRSAIQSFARTALLAAFALAWWKGCRRPALWTVAAGCLGVWALLAAETIAPIFSGAMLGIIGGLIFCRLLRKPKERGDGNGFSRTTGPWVASRTDAPNHPSVSILAVLTFLASSSLGQESSSAAPPPRAGPTHQVFIPIDDHEKPVGDRCYVPEDFTAN